MNEILNFLNESKVFFVSTVDGNQPKVRPFNFVMEYDGKLCFATSNQKPIYSQLTVNPNIEISATTKDFRWIRLSGKAVFCTTKDAKAKALDSEPMLKHMYSVDDEVFEIFSLENATATISSLKGDNKTINL
ncbi:pyridoxamine 5'-phosphate oxidase family protein [Clostridium saccharoperbutylacetonicum]|uniref:pyridoxamine 5'-phosphate oxidase family protein n=1 Tax=Clostridium saccharoperbutylacetonicum TaxID=36745 RepID=UPI000983C9B3|nr:pyridoxamine 5'-phosphate oxidase family protein [Clostridium saccharoperbutylacetonicum]AQR94827.1 pyridoxamine 5'-phosphate oxidase [Clostridium saccharoperbutylacetonicum]NSB30668.1 putative pyridoxamine 5'-phosphate oxidase family protein [Clostridium saccharoperbutylacetonicum]